MRALPVRVDWPAVLLVALFAILLWLTFLPVTRQTVRLAEAPTWFTISGFYGPEENARFRYRWSQPDARLTLPVSPSDRYTITLTLQDGPGAASPRPLTVIIDGNPVATLHPDSALREYRVNYARPGGEDLDTPLQVALQTTPRTAGRDARELGFVVTAIRWEVSGPPAPWQAALLAAQGALLGLAYATLRALRSGRGATPLLVASLLAAVAWFALSIHLAAALAAIILAFLLAVQAGRLNALRAPGDQALREQLVLLAALATWASPPALIAPYQPIDGLRGYVAFLLAAVVILASSRMLRPIATLGGYAALTACAAAGWYFWTISPFFAAFVRLEEYDLWAVALVIWVVLVFGFAACAVALLLPETDRRRLLIADLLTGIGAIVVPAGIWLARRGEYSEVERTLRVSWPGALLIALILAKTLVLGATLYRAAPRAATERRLALALLALLLAVSWSLAPWRMATLGISGDESGYLSAAFTLARDHDLELTNNGYSPWMAERVQYPRDAWSQEVPDTARDRFVAIDIATPGTIHYLPVVAGPNLTGSVGVMNTATNAAEITLRLDGGAGTATPERFTLAPNASRLVAIPAGADWRGATVETSAPVSVAVRLVATTGAIDGYHAVQPAGRFCVIVPAGASDAENLIFVHNGATTGANPTIVRYGNDGTPAGTERPTIAGGATLALPLPTLDTPQAVCVSSDQPLAGLGIVRRGESGLLALPPMAARQTSLAIPPAPSTTHETGEVALLVHNPGDTAVQLRRTGAIPLQPATIAPHATVRVALDEATAAEDRPVSVLELDGPVVAVFQLTLARHEALVAPAEPRPVAWFPAIVGEGRRFVATRAIVQNPGAQPLPVVVSLLDDAGTVREERRVTLCGNCASAVRLDFADRDGQVVDANGAVVVRAERRVLATVTQITLQSRAFVHEWGVAVALIPGVLLGGWLGAVLTIAGCGALLGAQFYGLLRDSGHGRRASVLATLILGLGAPLLPFSALVYPELVAMLLLLTGLRLALGTPHLRGWRLLAAVGCALAIPLLHTRLLPLAAVLAACLAWRLSGLSSIERRRWVMVAPLLVTLAALVGLWWLASPVLPAPLALSARLSATSLSFYFSTGYIGHHLAGILFDRATGLLPVAPVLALAPIGLLSLLRRAPRYACWCGLAIAIQFAVVALRADGWEAWGPAGRYMLPIVPLLGVGVAAALAGAPRWLRVAGGLLAAWGWCAAALFAWIPHAAYYYVPEHKWFGDLLLRSWGWPNPLRLFPAISADRPLVFQQLIPWLLLTALLLASGVRWRALFAGPPADAAPGD